MSALCDGVGRCLLYDTQTFALSCNNQHMKILIQRNGTNGELNFGSLIIDGEVFCDVMEKPRFMSLSGSWITDRTPTMHKCPAGRFMLRFQRLVSGREQLVVYKNTLTRARFVSDPVSDRSGNFALGRRVQGDDTLVGGEQCLEAFERIVREHLHKNGSYSMHIEVI